MMSGEDRETSRTSQPEPYSPSREQLQQLNALVQIEAEIQGITHRLDRFEIHRRDPGASVSPYVDGLVKRRAELLKKKRPETFTVRDLRAFPLDKLVVALGPFFTPWTQGNWPYCSEGIDQAPGVAGTSGQINTQQLFPGGLEYRFESDWWIRVISERLNVRP
jgi:hypothetical protein